MSLSADDACQHIKHVYKGECGAWRVEGGRRWTGGGLVTGLYSDWCATKSQHTYKHFCRTTQVTQHVCACVCRGVRQPGATRAAEGLRVMGRERGHHAPGGHVRLFARGLFDATSCLVVAGPSRVGLPKSGGLMIECGAGSSWNG
jgi:hypothetical protein